MFAADISAVSLITVYVSANVLMVASAALLVTLRALNGILPRPLSFRHLLRLGRILVIGAAILPVCALLQEGGRLAPLKAQVWAAPSMRPGPDALVNDARIDFGVRAEHALLPMNLITAAVATLFAGGLSLTLLSLLGEARALSRAIRDAVVLRRIGSIRILISDTEQVPFAAWTPWRAYVVLPANLLLHPADMRLALRHEVQHHRQGDTRYVYALLLWCALFGANPAVHWLARQLLELQELACDEALARRPSHCAQGYCACLLRIAETALQTRQLQLRSFMASWRASALRRRVEAVVRRPVRQLPAPIAVAVSVATLVVLGAISTVIATPVQDRRLSRSDARQLVAATPGAAAWGLQINAAVLRQLNLLLGTPDGRQFLRSSLERMRAYEPDVLTELKRYGLPMELRAVPLVESGYRNLPARRDTGAGLWMFIGPTARHYGLEVSTERDERLDVAAETGAAMRMFADLRQRLHSWPLVLMAYNSGTARVEAGMRTLHTRDAWLLYQGGFGNEPDYLARTTAMMLIVAHPELLAQ